MAAVIVRRLIMYNFLQEEHSRVTIDGKVSLN